MLNAQTQTWTDFLGSKFLCLNLCQTHKPHISKMNITSLNQSYQHTKLFMAITVSFLFAQSATWSWNGISSAKMWQFQFTSADIHWFRSFVVVRFQQMLTFHLSCLMNLTSSWLLIVFPPKTLIEKLPLKWYTCICQKYVK